jgi:hypothetical protein
MSGVPRSAGRQVPPRPRRTFDRSVALAHFRWEILRRTAEYRADMHDILGSMAHTIGRTDTQLQRECLENGGIIPRVLGAEFSSPEHYDAVCRRYGLAVLVHPDVPLSVDEMAAFPVFADTPARQPAVTDPVRLRHVARRGGNVSPRTIRRMFALKPVEPGPFRLTLKRIHLGRLERILAVFDARTQGHSFRRIAKDLRLSLDQAKGAWATARLLIAKWFDFESHLRSCPECHRYLEGKRDRMCARAEQQIGLRRTGGSRLRPTNADALELLGARAQEDLPARRAGGSWRGRRRHHG